MLHKDNCGGGSLTETLPRALVANPARYHHKSNKYGSYLMTDVCFLDARLITLLTDFGVKQRETLKLTAKHH